MLSEAKFNYYIYDQMNNVYFAGWKSGEPLFVESIHKSHVFYNSPGNLNARIILAERGTGIERDLKIKRVKLSELEKLS